ncbi:MAG: glycosyltransferase [Treponema sp.]|nr:glycosyltransferase [Treponema sp.]
MAQSGPSVSVVIPTYNRAHCIRRAMDSVLGQTFGDLELIVVDDGSTDDTDGVVRKYSDPRVRYVRLEKNGGPSRARNEGIRLSRGKYVAFQDSDDAWHPEKLERQMGLMDRDSDCHLVFCKYRTVEDNPRTVPEEDFFDLAGTEHGMLDVLLEEPKIGTPTMLVRKEALLEAGMFDEKLATLEDWDLSMRIARRGKISFVPEALVDVYPSSDGVNMVSGGDRMAVFLRFLDLYWDFYSDKTVFTGLLKKGFLAEYNAVTDRQARNACLDRLRAVTGLDDLHIAYLQDMYGLDVRIRKLKANVVRLTASNSGLSELACMLLGKYSPVSGGEARHCIDTEEFEGGTLEVIGWAFCGDDACLAFLEADGNVFAGTVIDRPDVKKVFGLAGSKKGFGFSVPSRDGSYRLYLLDMTRHELFLLRG